MRGLESGAQALAEIIQRERHCGRPPAWGPSSASPASAYGAGRPQRPVHLPAPGALPPPPPPPGRPAGRCRADAHRAAPAPRPLPPAGAPLPPRGLGLRSAGHDPPRLPPGRRPGADEIQAPRGFRYNRRSVQRRLLHRGAPPPGHPRPPLRHRRLAPAEHERGAGERVAASDLRVRGGARAVGGLGPGEAARRLSGRRRATRPRGPGSGAATSEAAGGGITQDPGFRLAASGAGRQVPEAAGIDPAAKPDGGERSTHARHAEDVRLHRIALERVRLEPGENVLFFHLEERKPESGVLFTSLSLGSSAPEPGTLGGSDWPDRGRGRST